MITVIQLGANRANDSLSDYLLSNFENIKFGLFVEPNSLHIESIKECYKKFNNVFIENLAVVPTNHTSDTLTLFYHPFDGPGYEIASSSIDHIHHHVNMGCLPKAEIKSFTVPCVTLEYLLNKYSITDIDWLLVDVEGLDVEILKTFNWDKFNVKKVEFEHLHLGNSKESIKKMFEDMGYVEVKSLHRYDWAFEKK